MRALAALALCPVLGLAGCGLNRVAETQSAYAGPANAGPRGDPYVGTTRWTQNPERICPTPKIAIGFDYKTCFNYSGQFTVMQMEDSTYRVETKDGRGGYMMAPMGTDTAEGHKKHLADKADCDRRGGVRVGMTRDQVYASCWGKPQSINSTIVADRKHDQLVYGLSSYVYLDNGVVTAIQTREK